jgi:hypothetical protein
MLDFDKYIDWFRVGMASAYLAIGLYAFGLFWWGWRQTRLWFLGLIVAIGAINVLLDALHVVIAFAEERLRWYVFGVHHYFQFMHIMYVVEPVISVVSVIGSTFLVRWVVRSRSTGTA